MRTTSRNGEVMKLKRITVEEQFPVNDVYYVVWTDNDSVGWVQATMIQTEEELKEMECNEPFWMDRDGFEVTGVTAYSEIK